MIIIAGFNGKYRKDGLWQFVHDVKSNASTPELAKQEMDHYISLSKASTEAGKTCLWSREVHPVGTQVELSKGQNPRYFVPESTVVAEEQAAQMRDLAIRRKARIMADAQMLGLSVRGLMERIYGAQED